MYSHIFICTYIRTYTHLLLRFWEHICIYIYICIHMYTNMYMLLFIYTHIYTYIYVYIYINVYERSAHFKKYYSTYIPPRDPRDPLEYPIPWDFFRSFPKIPVSPLPKHKCTQTRKQTHASAQTRTHACPYPRPHAWRRANTCVRLHTSVTFTHIKRVKRHM